MKTVLFYPPYSNPRTPYLSTPTLSAFLKANGHDVTVRDLNLDYFYDFLGREGIERECGDDREKQEVLDALPRILKARDMLLMGDGIRPEDMVESKRQLRWGYRRLFKKYEANIGGSSVDEIIAPARRSGHSALQAFYLESVIPWLREVRPGVAGISIAFPSQMGPALRLGKCIKEHVPGIHTVLGGPQVTKFCDNLAAARSLFDIIDSLVIYEGERPLETLLQVLEGGGSLSRVPNLIYLERGREEGRVVRTPVPLAEPINHLSTPDFSTLHMDRYLLGEMMLPIITSRGCYWGKCSFCTYREIHKGGVELRDTALVLEDMKRLIQAHGCRSFRIVDDALAPKRCRELSEAILAEGMHVKWRCSARLEKAFTPELCQLMARAGCDQVAFGLESYNQRVIDLMKKGTRVKNVRPILKAFKEAGIKNHLCIMIGFPTETREEAEETKRFLMENRDLFKSYGVQTYNLEADTELDRRPDAFGITRVFRDQKVRYGFRYGYQFATDSGLSREEAEEITKEIRRLK